ncbi:MAG: hypothetical protein FWH16_03085 [Oscillospiraceae bacterium]|nr:hypothetical protein [Oscillospiraceae bacterium]
MRINQTAVNPQQKLPVNEAAERADEAARGNSVNGASDAEENGVTLTVSQRNAVEVDNGAEAERPAGGIRLLLDSLMANPEDTAGLHAGLSPERVLQLLA